MAGNCSIYRSWNTGDALTASDLTNSLTTVGVTNMTPQCLDDYSADSTQMQSVVDPYPSSVISLATSTAGELERLRYTIKKLSGWSQWYAHTEAPRKPTSGFRGLVVGTHPDNDSFASKLYLYTAGEITLDDGTTIVGGWDRLPADITVSGAGGLDTGAEAASTWYEFYAIRKSSDGTKNVLIHRAKDYFADESNATTDTTLALRDASARTRIAQGFTTDNTGNIEFVDISLDKVSTPTGNLWVTIEADSSGVPSGTALATSDKIDVSKVDADAHTVRMVFRNPTSVTAGTKYHLVYYGDFAVGAAHVLTNANTTNVYRTSSYIAQQYDGATWSAATPLDLVFTIYVTRNDSSVTMPTGYDQKCLLGYAFNDSGSSFDRYIQHDRDVRWLAGKSATDSTTTAMNLKTSVAFMPPRVVTIKFGIKNSTVGNAENYLGPVPTGFSSSGLTSGSGQDGVVGVSTTYVSTPTYGFFPELITETQGYYTAVSAGIGTYVAVGYRW